MGDFRDLQERYERFIVERDWGKYHTPQNVAMAISTEANELLELFLWHDNVDSDRIRDDPELIENVREELADVLIYCMSMAIQLDIDLEQAVADKLDANEERFDQERTAEIRENLDEWQSE